MDTRNAYDLKDHLYKSPSQADILAREIQDTVTGLTQCQRGERKPLYRPVQDGSLDASRRRVVTHLGREA
ncbi:hypothetical protein CH63R_08747 [Colletotrichum higginsianum IMI 349063]|uniref:Uncharacterized protein n=1 Tax=Colletotrichum higginsianum (strain IMI 349063) TaxID=759273 RepID=A0A1B7Y5H9_COLHI|nr:hypothetical protein CH63R_08747 [Colletotrichum higginsianum IMI 349063]OBR07226.1 hypothetical protein CH63R_08747 [Colletotrichum higginsianum IMI 349063]